MFARLQSAHQSGRLPRGLVRLRRNGRMTVNEVGYIRFQRNVVDLFFQLDSHR
ncbi:hypothetical protein [Arthrobacter sp. FW305-BF8]|uniref:hypothetical protein n=1 Tax=Arthrobacter sp. FW305-BF8 TaxID=2879617 RepID=UPI003FA4CD72